jgi:alkylated DNA repair dioxygenase AlkB
MDPLLTSIKGRSRALIRAGVRVGGRADEQALSLSLANACNPLLQAHPLWRRTTRSRGFPPSVFRLAPTHLGWGTQRQFTRRSRDPPGVETPTNITLTRQQWRAAPKQGQMALP